MTRKLSATLVATLVAIVACAAPLTRNQALQRAQQSLEKQGISFNIGTATMAAKAPARGGNTEVAAYYIFNTSNAFVIASGDDRMPEVLGYSDNGTFNINDMPDGLKDLLDCYAVAAANLKDSDDLPKPNGSVSRSPIAPLLKSQWNQGVPYNDMCPIYDGTNRAVTGCVATAMAQVMNYWKWPATISKDIPAYTTKTKGIVMPKLSVFGFPKWSDISDYYTYNQSDASAEAVAKLMLYCGQSLEMNYNNSSGASTYDIVNVLPEYFRYAPTARYLHRSDYSAEDWANIIYNELAMRRPVVYRGSAYNGGGHSFVCDGVDANGLFHINWGWSGKSDGYFLLTNLNPDDQGAGSSVSNDGYIVGSAMVIGIIPENKPYTSTVNTPMYCTNMSPKTASATRSSASTSFPSVTLRCGMYSQHPVAADIDFGIGIYSTTGQRLATLYSSWFQDLQNGYGTTRDYNLSIPATIPTGTFYIKPMCRMHNTGDWVPCAGADVNYWKATITSYNLSIELVGNYATPSFKVNNYTFSKREVNRPIEMTVNLTNTGNTAFIPIYLSVDNKCTTLAQCALEPGQTGNITMHFSAATTGSHALKLSYDEEGTQILWQSSVYITSAPANSLTATAFNVKNATSNYCIKDNKFEFSTTVTNNGSSTFDDVIVTTIYRRAGISSGSSIKQIITPLNLTVNQSKALSFVFNDLKEEEDYFVNIKYYSGGKLVTARSSSFYTILGSPIKPGDVNGDGTVDIADVNIIINIILNISSKSSYPNADVNGDGIVDVADVNAEINKILGL